MKNDILVIESGPVLATVIANSLRSLGYSAMRSADTREAQRILEQESFGVVLMETWPDISETKNLIETIKRESPATKIILYGTDRLKTPEQYRDEWGVDAYVKKRPGGVKEIIALIQGWR